MRRRISKAPRFAFQEAKTAAVFLAALPLMRRLVTEGTGKRLKKIDTSAAVKDWKKARALGYRVYVAKNGDKILGVMGLTEIRDPLSSAKSFRINNFIVDKEFRGRGLGTAMMRLAEAIGRREKAQLMVLEVFSSNERAVVFYKNLGYGYACDRMSKRATRSLL